MTSKRRKPLFTLLLCSIVATLILVFANREDEGPVYEGKSLHAWVLQISGRHNRQSPLEARDAIVAIGSNALPYLLKWIPREDYSPQSTGRFAQWLLEKFPSLYQNDTFMEWSQRDANVARPYGVVSAYGVLGSNAVSAIPDLVNLANTATSSRTAEYATQALQRIGPPAWSALLGIISNQHSPARVAAIRNIAFLGAQASNATPILIECLHDNDFNVSSSALTALEDMKINPDLVIPALTNLLLHPPARYTSKTVDLEKHLAATISRIARGFGPRSSEVAPALVQFIKQHPTMDDAYTRGLIGDVSRMGDSEIAVPFLSSYLDHTNSSLRTFAAARLGRQTVDSLPALTNAWLQATGSAQFVLSNAIYKISSDP